MNEKQLNATKELKRIISESKVQGLRIEIIGSWLWLFGNTDSIESEIKKAGFKYNETKGGWYVSGEKSAGNGRTSLNYIHARYATIVIDDNKR